MPKMLCKEGLFCPGDSPLANFSAEAPDTITFFDINFGSTPPPIGKRFTATGCVSECESTISQDDADQCAARQAFLCGIGHQDPPPFIIFNSPQTCTVTCPDGLPFSYTVGGGIFPGLDQTSVDAQAHQFACIFANRLKVCLGNLQRCCCINQPYSSTITATGSGSESLTWILKSGAMPPGIGFHSGQGPSVLIDGTPVASGTFSFQVQATTTFGTFMVKTFTIVVLAVVTTSLPPFTIGVPYSFQLQATGGSGSYNWKIASGSLPPGLSMNLTGLISGTPM